MKGVSGVEVIPQEADQVLDLLRIFPYVFHRPRVREGLCGSPVASGRAPQAEVDAPGEERLEHRRTLGGDPERSARRLGAGGAAHDVSDGATDDTDGAADVGDGATPP